MFAGSHLLTVDDKGRLAIPARVRQQLNENYGGQQIFITRGPETSIEVYPASVFHKLAEDIQALEDRKAADLLKKIFVGYAADTEIDKQGRVVLPPVLRKHARVEDSVMLVGQVNRFDVWSEQVWADSIGADKAQDVTDAFALLRR
jgi:MraZ protein